MDIMDTIVVIVIILFILKQTLDYLNEIVRKSKMSEEERKEESDSYFKGTDMP